MRVVVVGAGSLGSLVGGLLATTAADVTLLGRESEHLDAIAADGLRVSHADGRESRVHPTTTIDPAAAGDADLLVVCVKSYDTDGAISSVAPHLEGTDVLTLQNGLGNAETLAEYVTPERVVAGTTTHGAVREGAGHVRHAGRGDTTIGRYFAENDERVQVIADALTDAGIETSVTDDPERAVWTKVLVNAGINAATALARVRNGALVEHDAGVRVLERAVAEGAAVARAEGVEIPSDVVDRTRAVARATGSNRSSMLQDVERGSRTEIEALNGQLTARASAHGVDAPVNETLADLVRLAESKPDAQDSEGRGQS